MRIEASMVPGGGRPDDVPLVPHVGDWAACFGAAAPMGRSRRGAPGKGVTLGRRE